MPAHRRSSRLAETYNATSPVEEDSDIAFVPAVTPIAYQEPVSASDYPPPELEMFIFEQDEPAPRRSAHGRKKPVNHIPRPPNAFILFRSAFIKSQHVSTGVETNHSTLSKIIGLTWQRLSNEERQQWHARAKVAQDEHKRRYPQYAFRPIHNKSKVPPGERKKLREVGPKDNKRCAKIAELLVGGKTGQELEDAIQEYDKKHVPKIVTRFEEPITAITFASASDTASRCSSPSSARRGSTPRSPASARPYSATPSPPISPPPLETAYEAPENLHTPTGIPSFDQHSFFPNTSPSFDLNAFAFSVDEASPLHDAGLQVGSPSGPSFTTPVDHDSSYLQGHPLQCTRMDDWARSCSPLSTSTCSASTCSVPTTPANVTIPFPDQSYGSFVPEAPPPPQFPPLDASYNDFSQYSYAPPMSGSAYAPKEDISMPSSNGISQNHGLEAAGAPLSRDDYEFSMFMASLPSYPL